MVNMKKFNTSPISGADEFLPEVQATFNKLRLGLASVYKSHGYQENETPHISVRSM